MGFVQVENIKLDFYSFVGNAQKSTSTNNSG